MSQSKITIRFLKLIYMTSFFIVVFGIFTYLIWYKWFIDNLIEFAFIELVFSTIGVISFKEYKKIRWNCYVHK